MYLPASSYQFITTFVRFFTAARDSARGKKKKKLEERREPRPPKKKTLARTDVAMMATHCIRGQDRTTTTRRGGSANARTPTSNAMMPPETKPSFFVLFERETDLLDDECFALCLSD